MKFVAVFLEHRLARPAFVFEDLRDDTPELLQDLRFAESQRVLVGNLVEVAHCLTAFAVQASYGKIDLLQAMEDFLNLARLNQRWQVQHHTGADSRTDIRRAGGQVTVLIMKCERQRLFKSVIKPVDAFPAILQVEAAGEDLQSQMVLFVNHHAFDLIL